MRIATRPARSLGAWTALFAIVVAAVLGAGSASIGRAAAQTPPLERVVDLAPGWNLVGWTGPDTTAAEAATGVEDAAPTLLAYDAAAATFRTFDPLLPAALSDLENVPSGGAVWVRSESPARWTQPADAFGGVVELAPGYNLVTWTGPTHVLAEEAFAPIAATLEVAFWWDPLLGRYLSYRTGPTAPLSDLRVLHYGDALWVRVTEATSWTQPAPDSHRCAPFPNPAPLSLGEWQAVPGERLTVEVQAGSTAEFYAAAVFEAADAALATVESRVLLPAGAPITVRVYEHAAQVQEVLGQPFNEFAQPALGIVHVRCGADRLGVVRDLVGLRHEFAHVVVYRHFGFSAFFLMEGIAAWAEDGIGLQSLDEWAALGQTTPYPPVGTLLTEDAYLATPNTATALATSSLLVRYLIEQRGGLDPFWRLWEIAREPDAVGIAPVLVYGADWPRLDASMRAYFGIR